MIRRVLPCLAAGLCAAAALSFGVAFVGVCRLVFERPGVERGVEGVARLQPWGLAFAGCLVAGLLTLWLVTDRSREARP